MRFFESLLIFLVTAIIMVAADLKLPPLCDVQGYGRVSQTHFNDLEDLLRQYASKGWNCPVTLVNPWSCHRAACVGDAEVIYCVEETSPRSIPCGDIADAVAAIADECINPNWAWGQGQVFSTDGWNVVVRLKHDPAVCIT